MIKNVLLFGVCNLYSDENCNSGKSFNGDFNTKNDDKNIPLLEGPDMQ